MKTNLDRTLDPLTVTVAGDEIVVQGLGSASIVLTADQAIDVGVGLMSAAVEIDVKTTSSKI